VHVCIYIYIFIYIGIETLWAADLRTTTIASPGVDARDLAYDVRDGYPSSHLPTHTEGLGGLSAARQMRVGLAGLVRVNWLPGISNDFITRVEKRGKNQRGQIKRDAINQPG